MRPVFTYIYVTALWASQAAAQPWQLASYTTKEGLSSNQVACVAKDSSGFLWVGTRNGLNRFDGNAFDVFYNQPQDPHSLASNEIQALHIDRQQRLWVGSVGGVSLYHPQRQQFSNYYPDSSLGKCGRWFCALQQADDGKLWVGTWYELLIFDPATQRFQRSGWADFAATHKPVNANNGRVVILSLCPKGPQELWVLTSYGLYSVHTGTRRFTWYPFNGVQDYYGCHISHFDAAGRLWMGSYNSGLLCYNTVEARWQQYLPPPGWNAVANYNRAYGIVPHRGDTLLFASQDGLALFDARQGRYLQHLPGLSLVANNIYGDGNHYWLTNFEGMHLLRPADTWVIANTPFAGTHYINKIYPLHDRPNQLVIGESTSARIGIWQASAQQFRPFLLQNGQPVKGELTGWLQTDYNFCLLSAEEAVYKIDLAQHLAVPLTIPAKRIAANDIIARNMVHNGRGVFWIRLRGQGILRYQMDNDSSYFEHFIPSVQDKAYSALYYNPAEQSIWVAVEHEGLYQYWPTSGRLKHHLLSVNNASVADITSICGDAAGNMYMSDAVRGLYRYNINNGSFTLYTRQNGLPSNNCHFTAMGSDGQPWVATAEGLAQLDTATGTATVYATTALPQPLSFLSADAQGNIYSCFNGQYYQWNIHQLPQRNRPAPLYLRSIRINNQPVGIDSVYELAHHQNNISLQVGAITPSAIDFEYMLNNSGHWLTVAASHALQFSNLAPGRYQLAMRQKGTHNRLGLSFYIAPPWWQRPWFWLLLVAGVALAVWYFVKRHVHQIRKQALLKQQMAETEMMALRAQMNPHFIFNCISSIDNFIQDNDKDNASAWLNKFAKLIRGVLDNSQQPEIPFWKDWDTLRLYVELEQLRASHSFDCEWRADEALLNGHYRIPPLIVQPYVENAIHHGLKHRSDNGGLLRISARLQGQQLLFTVEDNGIGRERSAALRAFNNSGHRSYGMRLSGERVQLFNAAPGNVTIIDLKDAAGNACGTRVQIILSV
jgi:ligand-binding sensor domain-containing protein